MTLPKLRAKFLFYRRPHPLYADFVYQHTTQKTPSIVQLKVDLAKSEVPRPVHRSHGLSHSRHHGPYQQYWCRYDGYNYAYVSSRGLWP